MTRPHIIDLAIFAHNEGDNIAAVLATLDRQSIFAHPGYDIRVLVLANGCSDGTAGLATAALADLQHGASFAVHDLPQGGKSRTWNRFVHDLSRPEAATLAFCDADIDLPEAQTVEHLVVFLVDQPGRVAASSRPVKDIVYAPQALSAVDKLTAAAGGTLDDWRTSICGQLYVMQAQMARAFHLPIGLPVEDGFVRAMIVTDVLRGGEHAGRIDGDPALFHIYVSERGIAALVHHQVRIVIGSAINAVLYDVLARGDAATTLAQAADDPDWLADVLRAELPRRYGYVPLSFLTKRLRGFWASSLKRKPVILAGFGFDAVVYVIAQIKMARGSGVGYW